MRILFATARRYPPDRHGGAQSSAHELLRRLVRRGHTVEVAAARAPGFRLLLFRIAHAASRKHWLGRPDRHNGYPTWRAAPWQLDRLVAARVRSSSPDVIVTDQPALLEILGDTLRTPVVLRVADVSFESSANLIGRPELRVFANSHFIATRLREAFGIEAPVLYPIVDYERYRTTRVDPRHVTFINPIEGKGLEVVLQTAALLPHRRFLFVSGWPRPTAETARLRERLRALPNVELRDWTADLRPVYATTRVLLFPARWEEGFGRVVLEAHASGIPVVASDRGGLPEAVGPGGRVLPYDAPALEWAAAVEAIMSDDAVHHAFSEAALANLKRPELDAEHITDTFIALLQQTVTARAPAPGSRAPVR